MRTLFTEKQRTAEALRKARADYYIHPTKDNAKRVQRWSSQVEKENRRTTILSRMGYA